MNVFGQRNGRKVLRRPLKTDIDRSVSSKASRDNKRLTVSLFVDFWSPFFGMDKVFSSFQPHKYRRRK